MMLAPNWVNSQQDSCWIETWDEETRSEETEMPPFSVCKGIGTAKKAQSHSRKPAQSVEGNITAWTRLDLGSPGALRRSHTTSNEQGKTDTQSMQSEGSLGLHACCATDNGPAH